MAKLMSSAISYKKTDSSTNGLTNSRTNTTSGQTDTTSGQMSTTSDQTSREAFSQRCFYEKVL